MKTFAIITYILFSPFLTFGQPIGGEDIPTKFSFRFFDKQGKVVIPDNKNYEVKIHFGLSSYNDNDSVKFSNGYFSCVSFAGAMVRINFISGKDTMRIYTSTSHDSIPFLKGDFLVISEYAPIFSIIPHRDTKINKRNWENFKISDFKETIFPDTLKKIDCQFWKDYKERIPLDFTPRIFGLLYNQDFSSKIYAWDWNNLYVSTDKGKNWENILTVNEPYETPIVSFKDKNTLILFKTKKYQKLINKKPEVYFSKDGGLSWQIDSTYTKMGFYFVGFNDKNEGFAYSIKYFIEERETKTAFYTTKNGGKRWTEESIIKDRLFPQSITIWENNIIAVVGNSWGEPTYYSFNEGRSWEIISNTFRYYQSFGNIYPSFSGNDFIHFIEKNDNVKKTNTKLLTIKNDWYVYMTATKNIWCVSGQGYTLISKDQGKNWNFYYGSVAGTSIFTIIDDKYIFNGSSLFEIK